MPLVQACSAGSARVPPPREKFGHGGRKQAVRKRRQIDFDSSTPESRIGRSLLFVFRLHRLFAFRWISGLGGLSATPAQLRTQGRWIRENGDFAQSGKFEVWKTKTAGMRDQSVRTSYLDTTNDFGAISEATRRRRLLREICSILHLARAPRLNKPNRRFFDIRFFEGGGSGYRRTSVTEYAANDESYLGLGSAELICAVFAHGRVREIGEEDRGDGMAWVQLTSLLSLLPPPSPLKLALLPARRLRAFSRVEWVELAAGLGGLSGLVDGWLSTAATLAAISTNSTSTSIQLLLTYTTPTVRFYIEYISFFHPSFKSSSSSSNTYVQWDAHFCAPSLRCGAKVSYKGSSSSTYVQFIELTGSTGIRRRENVCQSMDMIYLLILSLSSTSNCGWSECNRKSSNTDSSVKFQQIVYVRAATSARTAFSLTRVDLLSFYSVNEFSIFELDEFEQDLYKNRFILVNTDMSQNGGGGAETGWGRGARGLVKSAPAALVRESCVETCLRLGGRSGSGGSRRDGGTKAALASWWRRIDAFGVFGTPPNGGGGGEFGCSARGGVSAASGRRGSAAGGGVWVAASPQASYESVSTGKEGYKRRSKAGRWWWRVGGGRTRSPLNFCLSRRSSQEEVRQYRDSDFVGKAGP
ncbi:hypothetical protein R3P38DRAFT_3564800 [Favolaschia claudopus]|uniref:Uncharacterized protein n=1 Tax=Favolaschia claudopus TaxID=2862362 RepID=A0AAW0DU55_9AGAR